MDRRQQKTRDAIFKAFRTLLSAKSFEKITVQEIIDEANIGRTTFYDHFETKDYLLKEVCADLFAHVFSDTLSTENTHDFSFKTGDPQAIITHILYHLLDNRGNILGLLAGESSELLLGFFKQYLNEIMAVRLPGSIALSDKNIPEDFLINHFTSSFVGMIQWWIKNKLQQSPEIMTEYFMSVTAAGLF